MGCRVCNSDTEEFESKYQTTNEGLGIEVREGESQHFGAPLFKRGEYVLHELEQVVQRHAADTNGAFSIDQLRIRASTREPDGCSLTLTQASGSSHAISSAYRSSMMPSR